MIAAITLLVAAHAFDYVTFMVMTARHGMMAELNPVVVALEDQFGMPGLTLAKVASVAFLAFVIVVVSPYRRRMAAVLIAIGVTAGMVGGVSNIASI